MIIQFINRKKELDEISKSLESNRFEFIILYGRRRIGKTELALNATKTKKRLYYLATTENNLQRFYNRCINFDENISKLKPDFEILFDYLKDTAEVIIIDEFQNMIKENKNITSLMQAIVDTKLKKSKTKLFLLGSSISMINTEVLSYRSPLYGRRTGSFKIKPVSFFELNQFFPKCGIKELIEIYGFADGIPFYLINITDRFWVWLQNEIKQERSFLRDEADFLMLYEFEDPGTYRVILEAIANGKTKLGDIKNFIKVKRTDITPYLRNLIGVDFIKREVPITENIKSRLGRYYIKDNFLKFWFRYVYPNLSSIEEGIFDASLIKKEYDVYLGSIFEDVSRQFLINTKISDFTKIGRWWHRDKEIDIVALNEQTKEILFGECKWKGRVNAEAIVRELHEISTHVKWNNENRKESYAVFAKSFTRKISKFRGKQVQCFDLKDIEKAIR